MVDDRIFLNLYELSGENYRFYIDIRLGVLSLYILGITLAPTVAFFDFQYPFRSLTAIIGYLILYSISLCCCNDLCLIISNNANLLNKFILAYLVQLPETKSILDILFLKSKLTNQQRVGRYFTSFNFQLNIASKIRY